MQDLVGVGLLQRGAQSGDLRFSRCHRDSGARSEEHTSELQSLRHLVCRLLLEKTNAFPLRGLGRTLGGGAGFAGAAKVQSCRRASMGSVFAAFFLKIRGPPRFSTFPSPDAFRS